MKKFLLASAFSVLIASAFAQSCPTNAKRNNGNNCTQGGTGGGIEVEFVTAPNPLIQIFLLVDANGGTATVIEQSKVSSTRAGKTFIDWCFETDNIGPVSQGSIQYQFYIDANINFQRDASEAIFTCSQATLPVTFAYFNAQLRSGKASLTWETATELNNKGFEVERRIGSGGYKAVGFVFSQTADGNSSSSLSYSFEDASLPANSLAYYRLRQVDLDGKANYSDIRAVRNSSKVAVSLYPNPSRGTVNLAIPSGSGMFDVSLDDMTGKSVQRWTNQNTPNMQINNLRPGMYMLRINFRDSGEQVIERVLVQ